MGARVQIERLLHGGLNLLPPSDLIGEADAIRQTNFRVDQVGQLRSRKGSVVVARTTDPVHTLYRTGNQRYAGAGSKLLYGTSFESEVVSGFDWEPLSFITYMGFTWVMNRGLQGRVNAGVWRPWLVEAPNSAPVAALGGAGGLSGDLTFWVTYIDGYGNETNASEASAEITASSQQVTLTIPTSPDSATTGRNIYMQGGGLDTPLLIYEVGDNTTTSVTVDPDIDAVQARDREMPVDHDPPPPARGAVGPYYGKILAWSSEEHPSRFWWTPTARPGYFRGSNDDSEGDWEDCGEDKDEIVKVTMHKNMVIFYKQRSIWRLIGDPDTNDVERVALNVSPFGGARAVVSMGTHDFFLGSDGLYRFNGDFEERISQRVDPIFKRIWSESYSGQYILPMDQAFNQESILGCAWGRLFVSYPSDGSSKADTTLVYNTETQQWGMDAFADELNVAGVTSYFFEGRNDPLLIGVELDDGSGAVIDYQEGETDDGNQIPLVWQSRYSDQGLRDTQKVYTELSVDYQTAELTQDPSKLTFKAGFDGAALETLGELRSATRTTARFSLPASVGSTEIGRQGQRITTAIEGDANSSVIIYGVYLRYYIVAREGLVFDSGVIEPARLDPCECDCFEVDLTTQSATHDFQYDFYADLPGGLLALKETKTFRPGLGRQCPRVYLEDGPYHGKRYRVVVRATTEDEDHKFQVHALRLRVRRLGEYIDGAKGQYWETPPFDIGG